MQNMYDIINLFVNILNENVFYILFLEKIPIHHGNKLYVYSTN